MSDHDGVLPHSQEAEQSVIGAVLINPDLYHDLADGLQADDFYIHRHRWIWEAITKIVERRSAIDVVTVSEELHRQGKLAEVGGPAYLAALINRTPTSLHAREYGRIVEQTAIRRRMLAAAGQVAKLACQEANSLEIAIAESEKALFSAYQRLLPRDVRPVSKILEALCDNVGRRVREQKANEGVGIQVGFPDVDQLLQGMQPADLLIVAGRPGTGKTSLLLSVVKNVVQIQKKCTAVFTLEMTSEQLAQRLLAQESGIETQKIRAGRLSVEEWEKVQQAATVLGQAPLYLDDTPSITPAQIMNKAYRLQIDAGLALIVIDYLQLANGGGRFENRVQEISYISRQLKATARELNVPVLAAAQLSRAVEQRADKHPVLSDLRESGSIEQDADVVMLLYRPEQPESQHQVDVLLAKHRNGPTGTVRLKFQSRLTRFESFKQEGLPYGSTTSSAI